MPFVVAGNAYSYPVWKTGEIEYNEELMISDGQDDSKWLFGFFGIDANSKPVGQDNT